MKAKMKQILDDVLKQSGNPQATEQIPKFPIDRVKTGKDQHYERHYTRYYARYNDRLFTDIVKLMTDIMTDRVQTGNDNPTRW